MAVHAANNDHGLQHARLRQLSGDPTRTRDLRDRFERDVIARFRRVRGLIRTTVGYENDALQLRETAGLGPDDGAPAERFPVRTDVGLARAFESWLRDQLRQVVLEPAGRAAIRAGDHWLTPYIRQAYVRGWKAGTVRLQQRGVATGTELSVEAILQLPRSRRQLARLYNRAFENLQGITRDTAPAVRDVLTEGLARGWHPRKMADRLTDEVRDIQNTRAIVLARTETIHSYTQATIDRYERAGVESVTGQAEWATADDDRVCPICEHLEGDVFSLQRIKTGTFTFEPSESEPDHLAGEYPLRPPVHPQCRCALLPVVDA